MATQLSQPCAGFGEAVPANDVSAARPAVIATCTARAAQAAIEVATRAAWLTWQIDALEVNMNEARYQLSGIADDLARYADRLPEDVLARAMTDFAAAQAASVNDDLTAMAAATRQIRTTMEQFHKSALV